MKNEKHIWSEGQAMKAALCSAVVPAFDFLLVTAYYIDSKIENYRHKDHKVMEPFDLADLAFIATTDIIRQLTVYYLAQGFITMLTSDTDRLLAELTVIFATPFYFAISNLAAIENIKSILEYQVALRHRDKSKQSTP